LDPGQETVRWLNFRLDVRLNSILVNNKPYQGHSRVGQIDERGIGIMIPANLKKGDSAEFQFTLPESAKVLQVKAVLKSRTGFRYWFEFSDLSSAQKEQISRACKPPDPDKLP
jgi:PilZ domain